MLVNNYLEILLGSKVKVKILRALFRFQTKTFTSRELAEQIQVSHTAVLKSLADLQGMNIIRIESHGKSNLITLNRESYLYDEIRKFFSYEYESLNHLIEELREILPKAKSIALFGSIPMKKEKLNSDIDILIISRNKSKINEAIAKKQEYVSKKFGNVISAHIMAEQEFKKNKNSSFVKDILSNHILIKGDKL